MAVHLTPAQAAKLGIQPAAKTRTTRRGTPARDCLPLRCVTCREILARPSDENRHFDANPTHRRYEAVLS